MRVRAFSRRARRHFDRRSNDAFLSPESRSVALRLRRGEAILTNADQWRDLARAVALATNEQDAFSTIAREVSRAIGRQAWIVEAHGDGVRVLARSFASNGIDRLDDASEPRALWDSLAADHQIVSVGRWSAIGLTEHDRNVALIVDRADAADAALLAPVAVWLPSVLAGLRERFRRGDVDRQILDNYRLARRAGRGESADWIAQQLADHAARAVDADRVAVAMYLPADSQLELLATHGYPIESVRDRRIAPGDWVLGHVYASRRAVVVRDVRRLRPLSDASRGYRTFSFAAVPIVAGRRVLGVIAATDKADGTRFSSDDVMRLRTVTGIAALGFVASRSDAEANRLARAATVDSLTGLFNRRYFDVRLAHELERGRRAFVQPSILIIDIDDFKIINDTHGHVVGDLVLQAVARIVVAALRVFDVCARIGGDEIAVVMPSGDPESACACAERIRNRIATGYAGDERLAAVSNVTVSIGVAIAEPNDTPEAVMRRADEGLYSAKHAGKNCVRLSVLPRRPAQSSEPA